MATKKTKEERRAARAAKKQAAADRQQNGSSWALSKQVGGEHYKSSKIQHVEFCQMNRLPWCEASAIKYICRHRSKNGAQDVEKAIHYIELLTALDYGRREEVPEDMYPDLWPIPVEDFIRENEIPTLEAEVITLICNHQHPKAGDTTLMKAMDILKQVVENYQNRDDMALL